jgi:HD-GYP domain-containing protein (c-di-GMP phosphodiesterase class II)
MNEQSVEAARRRGREETAVQEPTIAAGVAVTSLFIAGAVALLFSSGRPAEIPVLTALVALAALGRRVRLEVGSGVGHAEQLAFVPMLFLAPLQLVPLLMAAAFVIARVPDVLRGREHPACCFYSVGGAAYAIGPVAVLALLAPGPLDRAHIGVYALALAVQLLLPLAAETLRHYLLGKAPDRQRLGSRLSSLRIDAVLTPVAYIVAAGSAEQPIAVLGIVPLLWLLVAFSRERGEREAAALELSQAYHGTVLMLSEVIEADDSYTGHHCRSVVELALAVGDELGVDSDARQELEMTALLHDVGKIAIPKEILNKPTRLTGNEFALIKTHSVEGQALLDRVGGRLAQIGQIVRSCHERWDGRGYPDGLAGKAIPSAARIVFCCDAFSAMTTDRPYRAAMSREAALDELRSNAGTQFEPRAVAALTSVIETFEPLSDTAYPDVLRALVAGPREYHSALPTYA